MIGDVILRFQMSSVKLHGEKYFEIRTRTTKSLSSIAFVISVAILWVFFML